LLDVTLSKTRSENSFVAKSTRPYEFCRGETDKTVSAHSVFARTIEYTLRLLGL